MGQGRHTLRSVSDPVYPLREGYTRHTNPSLLTAPLITVTLNVTATRAVYIKTRENITTAHITCVT